MLFVTLREAPADADLASHRLLVRGGFIRRLAAGVYSYLPLGWRVLRKVEAIVREEMDAIGGQELLLPTLHPEELWKESGRADKWGPELIRVTDRNERIFCLGATHEEVITEIARGTLQSYRQLPTTLYQIQTKFRDEPRPRGGLIRSREFVMKDAYSFHRDEADLAVTYTAMDGAYRRIFERCGCPFVAVEADASAMGGSDAHEFMQPSESGEDMVLVCSACDYKASLDKAEPGAHAPYAADEPEKPLERVATPGMSTIEQVSGFLNLPPERLVKTLIYRADGQPVAALVRGDRDLNEVRLRQAVGANALEMGNAALIREVTGAPVGFAGPVGLKGARIVADPEIQGLRNFATGANEADAHLVNVNVDRDFRVDQWASIRYAAPGDSCARCGGVLEGRRAIELGHIFKLGTFYSDSMQALYADEDGAKRSIVMGCYGIGISRIVAAAIEAGHDDNGIIWPLSIAPYQAIVTVVNPSDATQAAMGDKLHADLEAAGVEVILDDRDERPGVKFKDADLLGIPLQRVVGKKAAEGLVEARRRGREGSQFIPGEQAVAWAAGEVAEAG